MRIATAAFAAATVALTLTACSSGGGTGGEATTGAGAAVTSLNQAASSAKEAVGSAAESAKAAVGSAAESAAERASSAVDQAKLSVFTATFRTAYPNLAAGRDDASIQSIVTETCPQIAAGENEQAVIAHVSQLATNGGTVPTPDQANRIYQLVKVAC